jgi:uncharacterized protein (DUF983 family)
MLIVGVIVFVVVFVVNLILNLFDLSTWVKYLVLAAFALLSALIGTGIAGHVVHNRK